LHPGPGRSFARDVLLVGLLPGEKGDAVVGREGREPAE
jgi:hypothetical protein